MLLTRRIELQLGQDDQRLELIRGLLNLEPYSLETAMTNLERHRGNVMAEFKNTYGYEPRPGNRLAVIMNESAFRSWRNSADSCILLLVGQNKVIQARHCWLSPIALDFVLDSQVPKVADTCVFYILGVRDTDDTFEHVLSSLIYRLLAMNGPSLRDGSRYQELSAELHRYGKARRTATGLRSVHEALGNLALRVLNMFDPSKTVWIILDRLDQCRGNESRNLHRKTLLRVLVKLVEDPNLKVRVRVLAVVNGVDWKPDEERDELGQTKDGSIVFCTLHQNKHT